MLAQERLPQLRSDLQVLSTAELNQLAHTHLSYKDKKTRFAHSPLSAQVELLADQLARKETQTAVVNMIIEYIDDIEILDVKEKI